MSGTVLVVDPLATNRIIMKVKLGAARYQVRSVETSEAALEDLRKRPPDLVLVNLGHDPATGLDLCRTIRADPRLTGIAIIATGLPETSRARLAALEAGADDTLAQLAGDDLLISRVRNQMRRRTQIGEVEVRDPQGRIVGFKMDKAPPLAPFTITVLSDVARRGQALAERVRLGSAARTRPAVLSLTGDPGQADLFVVDGNGRGPNGTAEIMALVASLRADPRSRSAVLLVLLPGSRDRAVGQLLDVGADDVICGRVFTAELALRIRILRTHKERLDRLRLRLKRRMAEAVEDPLTGLPNRRYAQERLAALTAAGAPVETALILFDIDHFKRVNDDHGHAAGDAALLAVARRIRDTCGPDIVLTRFGGEEFLAICPGTDAAAALDTASRARAAVAESPVELPAGSPAQSLTVSAGVSCGLLLSPDDAERLLRRADTALYRAKADGRDRVQQEFDLSA